MPVQETFILPCLIWSVQYKIFFFLTVHYFNLCVPIAQQPGHWAGSRAGSPVSECVSRMVRDTHDIVLCACTIEGWRKLNSYHTKCHKVIIADEKNWPFLFQL
jgi:hypothetical protein